MTLAEALSCAASTGSPDAAPRSSAALLASRPSPPRRATRATTADASTSTANSRRSTGSRYARPTTAVMASTAMTATSTAPSAIAKALVRCSSFSTISRISSTSPLTISSIVVPGRFARRSML